MPPRRWSALAATLTAVAGFVAMTTGQLLAVLALGLGVREPAERAPLDLLVVTAAGAASLLLVLAVLAPRLLGTSLPGLGFRRPRVAQLRFAVTAALGLWLLSILANLVSISFFGPNPQALVQSFSAHRGADALALDLLTGVVVAPFAEEALYRGVVFAALAQRVPVAAAALASALLFAVPHGVGVLAPILVLGTGLAWVYWRTGTLWAPILAHAVVNAISLVVLFAAP
ncbi:MAG: lysostaphin resistance A-like protein, partial [Candidatus Limnocylindria bacterium]